MAFLNFKKKRGELPADMDLDLPPEPPKFMDEEISAERPLDEELMPVPEPKKGLRGKAAKGRKEELPELPPLPDIEEELPPLPDEGEDIEEMPSLEEPTEEPGEEGLELPPPPGRWEEKRGLFSFFKTKKADKDLPLPRIDEEIPEMPPMPESMEMEGPPEMPIKEKEEISMPWLEEEPISVPARIISPKKTEKPAAEPLKQAERTEERIIPKTKFITIEEFKHIEGDANSARDSLKDIDALSSKFEEVKEIGDKEYAMLRENLQDIQRKIMFIDKELFKEVE